MGLSEAPAAAMIIMNRKVAQDFCKNKNGLATPKEWLSINSVKSALNASLNSLGNGAKPLSNGNCGHHGKTRQSLNARIFIVLTSSSRKSRRKT